MPEEVAAVGYPQDGTAGDNPDRSPRVGRGKPVHPWKTGIVTTIFSIDGREAPGTQNGGRAMARAPDSPNPEKQHNFIPAGFVPRLNPFYIGLPYNDVANG